MKCHEIANIEGFELAVEGENIAVDMVYCCDLMSWAMAKAPEGSAWCTVMGNVNAVAVASNADVAALVICEGAQLDEEAAKRAQQHGVTVFKTRLAAFEAAFAVAKAAGVSGL